MATDTRTHNKKGSEAEHRMLYISDTGFKSLFCFDKLIIELNSLLEKHL